MSVVPRNPRWAGSTSKTTRLADCLRTTVNACTFQRLSVVVCAAGILLGSARRGSTAEATPKFRSSAIEAPGSDLLVCDLDGDGLKDVAVLDAPNLSVFYQDPRRGFPPRPQLRYLIEDKPALVWAARVGPGAESLLLLTSRGVTALLLTNRNAPPVCQQLIRQRTLVPQATGDGPSEAPVRGQRGAIVCSMSARTAAAWPLLLVPVDGGLEVWRHSKGWERSQTLQGALEAHYWPQIQPAGYARSSRFSFSTSDVDGDGREDLMTRINAAPGTQLFTLYQQSPEGQFEPKPTMIYRDAVDWGAWLCWIDLNGDGRIDLIKSARSTDAWFFPGTRASKVVSEIHFADEQGRVAAEPQQVFRKDDSMAALPVLDVDGDGHPDLVLGSAPFDSREGLRKMITTRQIEVNLKFHFWRPGTVFAKEPDCRARVLIKLDEHAVFLSESLRDYFERCVTLAGDFNGDGRKDLLARDRTGQASVQFFLSRGKGFSREADLVFACPEAVHWLQPEDLNGDSVSDLIIKTQKRNVWRVFTSQ